LLLALFVIDGGATLLRFGKEMATFFSPAQNFRFLIYRDAINLILKSSPLGLGLGNFWPIFAVNRHYSANISQTAHPESDWLWGAVDAGWVGLFLVLALFCWWLMQCPPFGPGTNRLLRFAATVCGIAFAIHGLLDVSGHRLGALWPALFFGSIAIHPQHEYRRSNAVSVLFRIIGGVLLAVGLWWLAFAHVKSPPTTDTVERLRTQIDHAIALEDYDKVAALSSEALTIAPLDWMFYFKRGVAEAGLAEPRSKVLLDFAIARYLLPNWPDLYLRQGMVWLGTDEPDLAFAVWEEGMQHFPEMAPAFYADIFGSVKSDTALRDRWRKLGESDTRCLLVFLRSVDNTEFQIELPQLLADDRKLQAFAPDELKTLFALWYEKGDKLWLAQTLQEHPAWKKIAWRQLARAYADYQDYRQAYETVRWFSPPPKSPEIDSGESLESLTSRFRAGGETEQDGLMLARAEANKGEIDDAIALLQSLSAKSREPHAANYLEADLWARKGEWQKSWRALSQSIND
jgi:hypothetical protein